MFAANEWALLLAVLILLAAIVWGVWWLIRSAVRAGVTSAEREET